jgi:hypothetical protein
LHNDVVEMLSLSMTVCGSCLEARTGVALTDCLLVPYDREGVSDAGSPSSTTADAPDVDEAGRLREK